MLARKSNKSIKCFNEMVGMNHRVGGIKIVVIDKKESIKIFMRGKPT